MAPLVRNPMPVDTAAVTELLRAAAQAPSGDNCQPWRFHFSGQRLTIRWLPARAESLYDAQHIASWIALGALFTNLQVAAKPLGLEITPQLFPQGAPADVVACIDLRARSPEDDALFSAIYSRCANRRPYTEAPLDPALSQELVAIGRTSSTQLELREDPAVIFRVASLAAMNDRVLFENRSLHHGLFRWMRWTQRAATLAGDGLPIASLELAAFEHLMFRTLASWRWVSLLRYLGVTRTLPSRSCAVYRHSAAIGLLSTSGRAPEDYVRGGELVQRIWLTAAARGAAFQPITGVICLLWRCRLLQGEGLSPAHRQLIEDAGHALEQVFPSLHGAMPLMLFRLGYAKPPSGRAPRQAVSNLLTTN